MAADPGRCLETTRKSGEGGMMNIKELSEYQKLLESERTLIDLSLRYANVPYKDKAENEEEIRKLLKHAVISKLNILNKSRNTKSDH